MIKILLFEDDKVQSRLTKMNLETLGDYQVFQSFTGKDSLETVEQTSPDLVLLDINLPEKDGFEIASEMRRNGMEIPIIFLTERLSANDAVHGFEVGGCDYVRKPYSIMELAARITANIGNSNPESMIEQMLMNNGIIRNKRTNVIIRGGHYAELTPYEMSIFGALLAYENNVVDFQTLSKNIIRPNQEFSRNSYYATISSLRTKLSRIGINIESYRGRGVLLKIEKWQKGERH